MEILIIPQSITSVYLIDKRIIINHSQINNASPFVDT